MKRVLDFMVSDIGIAIWVALVLVVVPLELWLDKDVRTAHSDDNSEVRLFNYHQPIMDRNYVSVNLDAVRKIVKTVKEEWK